MEDKHTQAELNKIGIGVLLRRIMPNELQQQDFERYINMRLAEAVKPMKEQIIKLEELRTTDTQHINKYIEQSLKPLTDRIEKLENNQHRHNAFGNEI